MFPLSADDQSAVLGILAGSEVKKPAPANKIEVKKAAPAPAPKKEAPAAEEAPKPAEPVAEG